MNMLLLQIGEYIRNYKCNCAYIYILLEHTPQF